VVGVFTVWLGLVDLCVLLWLCFALCFVLGFRLTVGLLCLLIVCLVDLCNSVADTDVICFGFVRLFN